MGFNTTTTPKETIIGVELEGETNFQDVNIKYSYNVVTLDNKKTEKTLTNVENPDIKLVLDQGRNDFDGAEVDKGIWFRLTYSRISYALKSIKIEVTNENSALDTIIDAGYSVMFSSKMTFDTNLKKVVELNGATTWSGGLFSPSTSETFETNDKGVKVETGNVLIDGAQSYLIDFSSTRDETTKGLFFSHNKMFKYHSTSIENTQFAKPKNSTEYDDFKTAVEACTTGIKLVSSLKLAEATV